MINIINETEIQKLLSAARLNDIRDFTMIFLALSTGLRCSELVGLFTEDVCPFGEVSRILTVPTRLGKGGKTRVIPLNQDTRDVISEWIRTKEIRSHFTNSDSFLFVSHHTLNPLSSRDFQRIVKNYSLLSIGRSISPHTLRHTYATRMLKHTNIRVIQELLGHAWLNTTQIYTHVSIDDAQQAISNFKLPEVRT